MAKTWTIENANGAHYNAADDTFNTDFADATRFDDLEELDAVIAELKARSITIEIMERD